MQSTVIGSTFGCHMLEMQPGMAPDAKGNFRILEAIMPALFNRGYASTSTGFFARLGLEASCVEVLMSQETTARARTLFRMLS